VWRSARHDTVFNGHEIKAGETVVAWTAAANFDETYFLQSSQFDMKRSPNPHLTFGHGIHTCLGNPLARLEARIVLGNGFVSVTIKNNIKFGRKNTCEYTIPGTRGRSICPGTSGPIYRRACRVVLN
jgi:Cytochrome P450